MKSIVFLIVFSSFTFAADHYQCRGNQTKLRFELLKDSLILENKTELKRTHRRNSTSVYTDRKTKITIVKSRNSKRISRLKIQTTKKSLTFRSCKRVMAQSTATAPTRPAPQVEKTQAKENKELNSSNSKVFNTFGELTRLSFKPMSSPIDFRYDVFYYIPKSLRGKTNSNVLTFLHGGGASTSTRSSSNNVVKGYSSDLIEIAEAQKFILIMPSGSGLNWGSHILNYLRDLNTLIKSELDVNNNKMALAGHSMGAMAITRSAHWLTDQYSFFLPIAGGMDPKYAIPEYLSTYFNTTYVHQQGEFDHFAIFLKRCRLQKSKIEELEKSLALKSGFELQVYKGSHNYKTSLMSKEIKKQFTQKNRDLYQSTLRGVFYHKNQVGTDAWSNGNKYYSAPRVSYFWMQAKEFRSDKKVISFTSKVIKEENKVEVKITEGLKKLRVYLHKSMLDINKEVEIVVNDKTLFLGKLNLELDMSSELKKDSSFIYNSYVDLEI